MVYCVVLDPVLSQMVERSKAADGDDDSFLNHARFTSPGKFSFRSQSPVRYGTESVEKVEKASSDGDVVAGSPEIGVKR